MSTPDDYELDCSAVIADLWVMLDNECDSVSRERLRHHLEHCGTCLEHYGIEEQIKLLISRKCGGEKAPEALRQRLVMRFGAPSVEDESSRSVSRSGPSSSRTARTGDPAHRNGPPA